MTPHPLNVPELDEVEAIATDLGVPASFQPGFVQWIIDLAEILNEVREGLDDPRNRSRHNEDALKTADVALERASEAISSAAFMFDMEPNEELRSFLDFLLGPGGIQRLAVISKALASGESGKGTELVEPLQAAIATPSRASDLIAPSLGPYGNLSRLLSVLSLLVSRQRQTSRSRGGRPEDRIRSHILKELRELYVAVFKVPATTAPNSGYAKLCLYVFESYGISTAGLEEAIKRNLRSARTESDAG